MSKIIMSQDAARVIVKGLNALVPKRFPMLKRMVVVSAGYFGEILKHSKKVI
jgi:hypothetical protein